MAESGDISRLIGELSADLKPVRRLAPPWLRSLYWLLAVMCLALVLIAIRVTFDWSGQPEVDPYVIPGALASGVTAILAAYAAFQLSLPDRSSAWALLPVPAFIVWVAINGLGCVASLANPAVQSNLPQFFTCLSIIFALSIPLSVATIVMIRRARPLLARIAPGDDHDPEVDGARAGADPGDLGGDLEDVAGAHRLDELNVGVRREEALVAVGLDAQLGRHVAEELQAVGAVDQVAGVVGVGVGHVAPVDDGHPDLCCHHEAFRCWMRWTRKLATSPGVVPREKTRSTPSSSAIASSKRGPPTTSSGRFAGG